MQLQREGKDEERRKRDRLAQIEGRCSSRRSGFLIVYRLHAEDEEKEEEESNDDPGVCAVEIGDVLELGLCKHTCRPPLWKGSPDLTPVTGRRINDTLHFEHDTKERSLYSKTK